MKSIVAMAAIAVLAGCSSLPNNHPASLAEIERMKPDCANADIQMRWVEHQTQLFEYKQERSEYERRWVAAAKNLTWELKSSCLRSSVRK
jgi:hypothetical protein